MLEKVFVIYLSLMWLGGLQAGSIPATEIDCDDVDAVHEEDIHYCCQHPDGHNELIERCANQTGFRLPKRDEEAEVDIPADRLMGANCFSHCVFEGLKFMKDNKVDMQTVREHFNTKFVADPEYAKEMIDAFEMCKEMGKLWTYFYYNTPLIFALMQAVNTVWRCSSMGFIHTVILRPALSLAALCDASSTIVP